MAWHDSVELPALLPECFLHGQFFAFLVEMFQLDSVCFLSSILGLAKAFQLRLSRWIEVATLDLCLPKHSAIPHDFQCVSNALTYDHLVKDVVLLLIIFLLIDTALIVLHLCIVSRRNLGLFPDFGGGTRQKKIWLRGSLLLHELTWQRYVDDTLHASFNLTEAERGCCGVDLGVGILVKIVIGDTFFLVLLKFAFDTLQIGVKLICLFDLKTLLYF